MPEVIAVIGANYGDEGKGLITDYYAHNNTLVIRHNGGAQAGHTVTTPEGIRHVFSHVGAGYFQGADTYLSEYFICNPMIFFKELEELKTFNKREPTIYVNKECLVTTPYDVMFNQLQERKRGDYKHGSCGVGFAATIERDMIVPFRIIDILDPFLYMNRLKLVRKFYLEHKPHLVATWDLEAVDNIIEKYIILLKYMLEHIHVTWCLPTEPYGRYIFEGAQGLLLDQNNKNFPYVTRSNTGLKNVVKLCRNFTYDRSLNFGKLHAVFVTRCYATRHGVGPLPNEIPNPGIIDETNITNEYQEHLRFAPLDWDSLIARVQSEVGYFQNSMDISYNLAITWDNYRNRPEFKVPEYYPTIQKLGTFVEGSNVTHTHEDYLIAYGPTRKDVKCKAYDFRKTMFGATAQTRFCIDKG